MNVLVTIDANYADALIAMLKSLVSSNREEFDIYIAHSSLTCEDINYIKNSVACRRIILHPIKINSELFNNAYFAKRISKETYYRLLPFEYLPPEVDRILYLDPDISVINSIKNIYNIDFGDMIFAGAGHTYGIIKTLNRIRLNLGVHGDYINAGVLMINVDNMRKYITAEKIFNYISEKGKRLFLADQDVINGLFKDKIISLDPCYYNLDEATYKKRNLNLQWVKHNAVFIHYNGKNKPWNPDYQGVLNVFWHEREQVQIAVTRLEAAV